MRRKCVFKLSILVKWMFYANAIALLATASHLYKLDVARLGDAADDDGVRYARVVILLLANTALVVLTWVHFVWPGPTVMIIYLVATVFLLAYRVLGLGAASFAPYYNVFHGLGLLCGLCLLLLGGGGQSAANDRNMTLSVSTNKSSSRSTASA